VISYWIWDQANTTRHICRVREGQSQDLLLFMHDIALCTLQYIHECLCFVICDLLILL
jgi:hypothetical protein